MTGLYTAALIAYRQLIAALKAAAAQYFAAILCRHPIKKAMLAAAGNPLWLPGSLWHIYTPLRHLGALAFNTQTDRIILVGL